jgi:hypothetical protein
MVAAAILDAALGLTADLTLGQWLRKFFANNNQRIAFERALEVAFGEFRAKHGELAASLFDERFVKEVAAPELAKLLTLRQSPDVQWIAEAYGKQFSKAAPDVASAVTYLIARVRDALANEPDLQDRWHRRETAEMHQAVTAHLPFLPQVYNQQADLKTAITQIAARFEETKLAAFDEDQLLRVFGAASQTLLGWPQETAGRWIERQELEGLQTILRDKRTSLTVLLGAPGMGKSAILARLGTQLQIQGVALLALKADQMPKFVGSLSELDRWLNSPAPLGDSIRRLASERTVVLLIDQLDALCELMDQHTARLAALLALVHDLAGITNLHIFLSCRDFEFRHDIRLTSLKAEHVYLGPLRWEQALEVLTAAGIRIEGWSAPAREVMRTPQHLRVFIDNFAKDPTTPAFDSYQTMLDAVLRRRVLDPYSERALAALYEIASAMADEEELWLPRARFDRDYHTGLKQLVGAGILAYSSDDRQVAFAHQTMFDFVRARAFVQQVGGLADHVLAHQESLFLRPSLWSSLHYLRTSDGATYRREAQRLWTHGNLRLHLRLLLIEFTSRQLDPDAHELAWLRPVLDDVVLRPKALWAMQGSPGWFDRLLDWLPSLMRREAPVAWEATGLLRGALATKRDIVLTLMEDNWCPAQAYDTHVIQTLYDLKDWDERAVVLVERVLGRSTVNTSYARHFAGVVAQSRPNLAPRIVAAKLWADLKEALRNKGEPPDLLPVDAPPDEQLARRFERDEVLHTPIRRIVEDSGWYELERIARIAAGAFLEHTWPWFLEIFSVFACYDDDGCRNEYRRDRTPLSFEFPEGREHAREYPLSVALVAAITSLADETPESFCRFVQENQGSDRLVVHRVIARGLKRLATSRPDTVLSYLLSNPRRFAIGDSEDIHRESKRLVAAVAPRLSVESRGQLEHAIVTWHYYVKHGEDDDANTRLKRLKWDREHRLRLLRAFPKELLSLKAQKLMAEEERALPQTSDYDSRMLGGGWIGSPVSAEQMERAEDDDIVGLFDDLKDDTEWDHPRRWLDGGSIQASRAFGEFAKKAPHRVIALLDRFEPGLQERPVGHALEALAGAEGIAPKDLIDHIHRLNGRGFTSEDFIDGASRCLAQLANKLRGLDDSTCELLESWLADWAIEESKREEEPEKERGRSILWDNGFRILPHGNYPLLEAIKFGYLLREPMAVGSWLATLRRHIERRENPKVWQALAIDLRYLQNATRQDAVDFISRFFDVQREVLNSDDGVRLVAWIHQWLPAELFHSCLDWWRASGWPRGTQAAGELIMLRFCQVPSDLAASTLLKQVLDGTIASPDALASMRLGVAHSTSRLWGEAQFRAIAGDVLPRLVAVADESVAHAITDVFRISKMLPNDEQTGRLFDALTAHPKLLRADNVTFLLEHLKELLARDFDTQRTFSLCSAILDERGTEMSDIRTRWFAEAAELIDIALTLHRHPDGRINGLELFERLMSLNAYKIQDIVREIDRRI